MSGERLPSARAIQELVQAWKQLWKWRRRSPEGVELPDEHLPLILRALEHYADYLKATQRDDRIFRELAERMKRKPLEQQPTEPVRKRA